MGDQDRPEAAADAEVDEQPEQRGTDDDRGGGDVGEDDQIAGRAAAEAVAGQRQRCGGPDRDRDHGAQRRDLERGDERVGQVGDLEQPVIPLGREAVPGEAQPPVRGLVEAVEDHHDDRDERDREDDEDVGRQDGAPPERAGEAPRTAPGGGGRAAHVTCSCSVRVPKTRA